LELVFDICLPSLGKLPSPVRVVGSESVNRITSVNWYYLYKSRSVNGTSESEAIRTLDSTVSALFDFDVLIFISMTDSILT